MPDTSGYALKASPYALQASGFALKATPDRSLYELRPTGRATKDMSPDKWLGELPPTLFRCRSTNYLSLDLSGVVRKNEA